MVPGMTERERRAVIERQQEMLAGVTRDQVIGRGQLAPSPERRALLPIGLGLGAATAVRSLAQRARAGWEEVTELPPGPVSDRHTT